jgi:hypothetical protein
MVYTIIIDHAVGIIHPFGMGREMNLRPVGLVVILVYGGGACFMRITGCNKNRDGNKRGT